MLHLKSMLTLVRQLLGQQLVSTAGLGKRPDLSAGSADLVHQFLQVGPESRSERRRVAGRRQHRSAWSS